VSRAEVTSTDGMRAPEQPDPIRDPARELREGTLGRRVVEMARVLAEAHRDAAECDKRRVASEPSEEAAA